MKVSKFVKQKMSRPGGDSNLQIYAECSNLLSYRGQTFPISCFETLVMVRITNGCSSAEVLQAENVWRLEGGLNPQPLDEWLIP